jgi:hypothetical protein
MAGRIRRGKLYHLFTLLGAFWVCPDVNRARREDRMVGGIAIAMFVALVGWGSRYFGWSDPDGKVQLALITSFILGIIGGFKARG